MKYKLSLSLLTCLAISGGGYLNAALIKPDQICTSGGTDCTISNNTDGVNITDTSFKNITADSSKLWVGGLTNIDKIELKNGSHLEKNKGNMTISELRIDNTSTFEHIGNETFINSLINTTSTDKTKKVKMATQNSYTNIGKKDATSKGTIESFDFLGNLDIACMRIYNQFIIDTDFNIRYLESTGNEYKNSNVTLYAKGVLDGNTFTDSNISVGSIKSTNNIFKNGKLEIKNNQGHTNFNRDNSITGGSFENVAITSDNKIVVNGTTFTMVV